MIFIALMLLVVLTIMGITSTSTSIVENRIAVNEQLNKMAFYQADSGLYTSAKIIGWAIDEGQEMDNDGFLFNYEERYATEDFDFYDQITGLVNYDGGVFDIQYSLVNGDCANADCLVRADIRFMGTSASGAPEGGVVFGEGATVPVGAQEISMFFRVFSEGKALRNSTATVSAGYEKVLGVSGGL